MSNSDDSGLEDRTIREVEASTRFLLRSFKEKIAELKECGPEIAQILRFGVDTPSASLTGRKFFGGDEIGFVAIDGTDSADQQLDLLVFYVGAFAYSGKIRFLDGQISVGDAQPLGGDLAVSAAIPLSEEDAALVFGQRTQSGIEVDSERLPTAIMHLAEYYLAFKAIGTDGNTKVVLLDRTLAGDVAHLVWSTRDLIHDRLCILEGMDTPHGRVSNFDLELARMLLPNNELNVPASRSQLLKFAALWQLFEGKEYNLPQLVGRIAANQNRLSSLQNDFGELESEYHPFEKTLGAFKLKPGVSEYWDRVLSAALATADHIFNPRGGHPLRLKKGDKELWITADDLDFLVLIFVYALTRKAWKDNTLPIGLIKDTEAAELTKTLLPLLQDSAKLKLPHGLPNFNTDKMLLQTNSVVNSSDVPTPWHTVEMDAAFRTMVPVEDPTLPKGEARVKGAYRNVILPERTYLKTYIQLWSSEKSPAVRSHVFSFDRPIYAGYDHWNEMLLHNEDNRVDEKIRPALHFDRGSEITNLVMAILKSMSSEVIPEALGHNYPLFLADKKAKFVLEQNREAYLGAVAIEMAKSGLDQQVLFSRKFRDYRSKVEAKRKG
ncbi:MAG: hypothetical protein ABSB56_00320 [Nitrososphaerales archaeon]